MRDFSVSRSQGTKIIYITLSGSCQIRPPVSLGGPGRFTQPPPASPPGLLGAGSVSRATIAKFITA
jgi:hypothetical protein